MIGDHLFYSLANKGLNFLAYICERQPICQKAEIYFLGPDIFTTNKSIDDGLELVHKHEYVLPYPYSSINVGIEKEIKHLFDFYHRILPKDAYKAFSIEVDTWFYNNHWINQ